jgi:CRISPR/Cas system CMR-associated protein Cmr1 (group 7 of RAMP superfamily)
MAEMVDKKKNKKKKSYRDRPKMQPETFININVVKQAWYPTVFLMKKNSAIF